MPALRRGLVHKYDPEVGSLRPTVGNLRAARVVHEMNAALGSDGWSIRDIYHDGTRRDEHTFTREEYYAAADPEAFPRLGA